MTELSQPSARTRVPPAPRTDPDATVPDVRDLDREAALALLFDLHYTALLRLAVLLGADDAENIVAEAYYQLYRRWQRLRGPEAALAYLRSVVCNLTRMRLRHLQVVRKHAEPVTDPVAVASAESIAMVQDDQRVLIEALRRLPGRQREALVLRHWLGLRESEIATAMGISVGAVKSHTARGIATLTKVMEVRR
jgi:RNA polymerase sigma-70 factor (sigma-E family)